MLTHLQLKIDLRYNRLVVLIYQHLAPDLIILLVLLDAEAPREGCVPELDHDVLGGDVALPDGSVLLHGEDGGDALEDRDEGFDARDAEEGQDVDLEEDEVDH